MERIPSLVLRIIIDNTLILITVCIQKLAQFLSLQRGFVPGTGVCEISKVNDKLEYRDLLCNVICGGYKLGRKRTWNLTDIWCGKITTIKV